MYGMLAPPSDDVRLWAAAWEKDKKDNRGVKDNKGKAFFGVP